MDNSDSTSWGPRPAAIAACALGGLAFGVVALVVLADTPGRILAGAAAAVLLTYALVSWRTRPKLRLESGTLILKELFGTTTLARAEIDSIKVTEFRRIGRRVHLLEIEAGDRFIVLNRWDLGTDPRDVLDAIQH